jgi:endonuclease YncB( thermonuclease family)
MDSTAAEDSGASCRANEGFPFVRLGRSRWTRRDFLVGSVLTLAGAARAVHARSLRDEPRGLLVATGTMDLNQFWPNGTSDGDTALVDVERSEFEGRPTRAFEGAMLRGKPVLRDGRISVRWQGIDCPELHCRGFRQHWGEAPSVHLAAFLQGKTKGAVSVPVQVTTRVRRPEDVFDMYGRFIGDVHVAGTNLNHWMLENGWAFASLYDSLQPDEARAYLDAAAKATSPLLNDYTTDLRLWDPDLRYPRRKHGARTYIEAEDRGWVQYPKLFRRLVTFKTRGPRTGSLRDYLEGQSHRERVLRTPEFLEHLRSAPTSALAQFIDDCDQFLAAPGALVFQEAPATLYGEDGRRVLEW